ncbi:acyl carrier protein [Streptomyces sp. NPDC059255]|uniref:acyl carrier protein n=1 Tax=Streptomyces sp. NPDC059255 TaxID=3346793 RepID=UPI003676EBAF
MNRQNLDELVHRRVAEALEIEAVAPDADFFELGGQSFDAAKLVVRLREEVDVPVSLSDFFQEPTARHLTNVIWDLLQVT